MTVLQRIFEQSTDAVFGIDTAGKVRFANGDFERLLGHSRDQVRGASCATLLCGTDVHGKPFCGRQCPIPKTLEGDATVGDFDLVVRRADGDSVLVNVGACYTPRELREEAGQVSVFFSLRRVSPQRLLQRMATAPARGGVTAGVRGRTRLSSREKEILRLTSQGMSTAQIAARLCISTQTVRTHFKNIYPKIGVNSRAGAAVFAVQHGLH